MSPVEAFATTIILFDLLDDLINPSEALDHFKDQRSNFAAHVLDLDFSSL